MTEVAGEPIPRREWCCACARWLPARFVEDGACALCRDQAPAAGELAFGRQTATDLAAWLSRNIEKSLANGPGGA